MKEIKKGKRKPELEINAKNIKIALFLLFSKNVAQKKRNSLFSSLDL